MVAVEAPGELIHRVLDEAGASPADHLWADKVLWLMSIDAKVLPQHVALELQDVARHIAETGESACTIYGTAEEFAARRVRELREEGADAFENLLVHYSARDFVQMCFIAGAKFSVLFSLVLLLLKEDAHIGFLALPAVLGLFVVGIVFTFQHLNAKAGFVKAATTALALVALGAFLTALILQEVGKITDARIKPLWLLVVAGVLGILCYLYSKFVPDKRNTELSRQMAVVANRNDEPALQRPHAYDPHDTSAWEVLFVRQLRACQQFTEAQVQEHLQRSLEYAGDSGKHPYEEFGDPQVYAHSLTGSFSVKHHRLAWVYSLLSVLGLVQFGVYLLGDAQGMSGYSFAVLTLIFAWRAVCEWKKV